MKIASFGKIHVGLMPSLTLGVLLFGMYANMSLQAPLLIAGKVTIEIRKGDTAAEVVDSLLTHQIIKWRLPLKFRLKLLNLESSLQAGVYEAEPGDTAEALLKKIVKGESKLFSVTLVEGKRAAEYISLLKKVPGIISTNLPSDAMVESFGSDFPDCGFNSSHIEGRFFPDTYMFPGGTTDIQVLHIAARKMCDYTIAAWETRQINLPYATPYDALIMASIIEKEFGLSEEAAIIANVFIRRLSMDMLLQADPTVVYGRPHTRNGPLTRSDLNNDTPYNTYTRKGLPLSAISTPSKISINAAFNPRPGNELYFVSKGDGTHHFSATLKEHLDAVVIYQRSEVK